MGQATPQVVEIHGQEPDDLVRIAVDLDGFTLRVAFREDAGRLDVYSLEAVRIGWKDRQPRPLTASNMRRIPWAKVIETARLWHYLAVSAEASQALDDTEASAGVEATFGVSLAELRRLGFPIPRITRTRAERTRIEAARRKLPAVEASMADRTARRGRPAKYNLHMVADAYQEGCSASPGSPTKWVAERLGVSRSTAAKQVARARAEGLLPPAPGPGVGGCE